MDISARVSSLSQKPTTTYLDELPPSLADSLSRLEREVVVETEQNVLPDFGGHSLCSCGRDCSFPGHVDHGVDEHEGDWAKRESRLGGVGSLCKRAVLFSADLDMLQISPRLNE